MTYRAPTIAEAVAFLRLKEHDRRYRRQCLAYWAEKYGAELAQQIEARVQG